MSLNKISCVIHTYNSSEYLSYCLKSVEWCDEVVVIDMYSTDNTVELAKSHNATVYYHENVGYADPARAYGLSKCTGDWILALDSDEIVSEKLRDRLLKISQNNLADVLEISFVNYFFGREIKGSGWGYKDQVIPRFFRKGMLSYGVEVHNFTKVASNARVIKSISREASIIHFNYNDVSHFIRKLNTYTDKEIYSTKYKYKNYPFIKIFYFAIRELLGRFLIKNGYRDGWVGLYLAFAMAFYRATSIAKANLPKHDDVVKKYQDLAIAILCND